MYCEEYWSGHGYKEVLQHLTGETEENQKNQEYSDSDPEHTKYDTSLFMERYNLAKTILDGIAISKCILGN